MLNLVFFFLYQWPVGGGGHQKVFYKHNVRTTILRSRSISEQSWVLLWTPDFFVMFFVVDLGGVVFRFPNNFEKNLNKSFKEISFSHILMKLTLMSYNGTRSLLILRSNYQLKKTNRFKKRIWFPQRCVFTSQVSIA